MVFPFADSSLLQLFFSFSGIKVTESRKESKWEERDMAWRRIHRGTIPFYTQEFTPRASITCVYL